MGEVHWFYRDEKDWIEIACNLPLKPCPHCHTVGMLIRHGGLRGFDETSQQKVARARRVFCSNRNRRRGCGRTFSVWLADKIRRLSLTTRILWRFLIKAVAGTIAAALRDTDSQRSDRTWQRIWRRFHLAQSPIRTALANRFPLPKQPAKSSHPKSLHPAAESLDHLRSAFPNVECPIAAFQHTLQTFFL